MIICVYHMIVLKLNTCNTQKSNHDWIISVCIFNELIWSNWSFIAVADAICDKTNGMYEHLLTD